MFIDAHNHLGVRHGASQTAAEMVARIDSAGVDRAVVFPFVEGDFSNDVIVDAVAQYPDRLIPYAAINPWRRQAAVDELESLAGRGFRGLKVHPTLHGYHLSDLGLMGPVMETLRAHRMVLISHGASDLYNAPPEFGRLARAFPDVPVMAAHSGTFWSHDQAIEVAAENPNLYLETARVPVFEVTHSIRELGAEKVVWGTDSPFVDYEFEFTKMRGCVRTDEEHSLVCGGNLARLLDL